MDDQIKKAFELAVELSKQLIALSTGIIALTITFREKIAASSYKPLKLLGVAWLLYLASVICGIWHLMALTGTLAASTPASLKGFNVRIPVALEITSFVLGTVLITLYGVRSMIPEERRILYNRDSESSSTKRSLPNADTSDHADSE